MNFIKIQTDKCHINLTLTGNETRLLNKCCDEKHKKTEKKNHFWGHLIKKYQGKNSMWKEFYEERIKNIWIILVTTIQCTS